MKRVRRRVSRWLFSRAEMIRHSEPASMLATIVLLAVVVLAPLPYAGTLPRDRAALQVAAFFALAIALVIRRDLTPLKPVRVPLIALVGLSILGLLQTLPLPTFITELIAPTIHRLWTEAEEMRGQAAPLATQLSLAPEVSRQTALHLSALAACLAAACLQASERPARRILSFGLVASVLFQIVYGADKWLARSPRVWGLELPGDASRLRGTFVNPDHFAFYLGLIVPCAAAWLWWAARKTTESKESVETRLIRFMIPLTVFCAGFAALAFTGSRAGLVAVVGALAVQGLVLAVRYRRWQLAGVGAALLSLGLAAVWFLGWSRGIGRWSETSVYEIAWNARLQVWWESLELLTLSPLVGTGLGTFRQAFPLVQPDSLPGSWRHAHSDVLELMITGGLWTLPLLIWVLVSISRRLWQLLHKGRRSEDRMSALAAFGAVAVAFLHSLVEFALTMPANAFTLAILLGITLGTPVMARQKRTQNTVFLPADASAEPLPGQKSQDA